MSQIEELGETLFLTAFQDETARPEWRRNVSGEMIFARGFFPYPDGSELNKPPFPLMIEISRRFELDQQERVRLAFAGPDTEVAYVDKIKVQPFSISDVQEVLANRGNL